MTLFMARGILDSFSYYCIDTGRAASMDVVEANWWPVYDGLMAYLPHSTGSGIRGDGRLQTYCGRR